MQNRHPIIWIVGATRSSKTALAQGIANPEVVSGRKLLISTGDFFREKYAEPDTFSKEFVFNLSAFAAQTLSAKPDCHYNHLAKLITHTSVPCIIEGERNPQEFSKLYDPSKDMVFFLERKNIDIYDTTIERGITVIEQIVRWSVNNGTAPQESVMKMVFGDGQVTAKRFGFNNESDTTLIQGPTPEADPKGTPSERYPWIDILIGLARQAIITNKFFITGDLRAQKKLIFDY